MMQYREEPSARITDMDITSAKIYRLPNIFKKKIAAIA